MHEESLRSLFKRITSGDQPPSPIRVTDIIRRGRLRRRHARIGTVGTPVLAAVAVGAIALAGALPSGDLGKKSPPAGSYGKLADGAFNPSYLAIKFGWLPAGTRVTSGETSPGWESLATAGPHGSWTLNVSAPGTCHFIAGPRRLACQDIGTPPVTADGPVVDGRRSLWLERGLYLAWEYAPNAWAQLFNPQGQRGRHFMVPIARAVEYHQRVLVAFASRFTSLPRGWRILGLQLQPVHGLEVAASYQIGRLATIGTGTATFSELTGQPMIAVDPAAGGNNRCEISKRIPQRRVIIHGHTFKLAYYPRDPGGSIVDPKAPGGRFPPPIPSFVVLCAANAGGLFAQVVEYGAHQELSPTKVMERLQLLGTSPARWVTNPIP